MSKKSAPKNRSAAKTTAARGRADVKKTGKASRTSKTSPAPAKARPQTAKIPAKKTAPARNSPKPPASKQKSAPPPAAAVRARSATKPAKTKKSTQPVNTPNSSSSTPSGSQKPGNAARPGIKADSSEIKESVAKLKSGAGGRRKLRSIAPPVRVAFSYEEAIEVAKTNLNRMPTPVTKLPSLGAAESGSTRKKVEVTAPVKVEARVLKAASLADILGFDPASGGSVEEEEAAKIPEKWSRYYKLLVELRRHIKEGLTLHSEETLMKSAKEDSGDLSGYSQHMADSGTDTFDRDFALSVVANEQEALNEIEAAIKRMHAGTYGVCELTAKPIARERLLAVPFARYSVESQAEVERAKRQRAARGNILTEFEDEEGGGTAAAGGGEDDASDE